MEKFKKGQIILFASIVSIVLYFVMLPPINIQSMSFYTYIFMVAAFFSGPLYLKKKMQIFQNVDGQIKFDFNLNKPKNKSIFIIVAVVGVFVVNSIVFSPLVQADLHARRISINDGSFRDEIDPISKDSLPLLDYDSTQRIGDRVMGEIPELISQFTVSNAYTQINYDNHLVRVTPLEYADVLKWLFNKDDGIPGYIQVDSTNGEADFKPVDGGINYSPSSLFFKNLSIHLRLSFPTEEFATSKFEIDEDGHPYWITPTIKYIGIGKLPDIKGVIATNATTGINTYYDVESVPSWIDNVYPSSLIIKQIDSWGTYQGGFLNSIFGQRDVKTSTSGYTYITTGDDVSLYTGITSVTSDQSNIGFVLVNLRNKDATYYAAPGAQEVSAMQSAQGAIQEKQYTPTFPLLTNVDNRPTYLLSLKDRAGLVKAYALVDVADYQRVMVTDSNDGIEEAINNYRKMMGNETVVTGDNETEGLIVNIKEVVIDGQSYFYFMLNESDKIYKANINISDYLPFIVVNDNVKIKYNNELFVTDINKK